MDPRQSDDRSASISGIWLPLVTPFREGHLDERSLVRLLRHYLGQPVDGLILAATTGEGLTLDEAETERLAAKRRCQSQVICRWLPDCTLWPSCRRREGEPPRFHLRGHCTGTTAGAPLFLIKTTRNFAGSVLLAFRSTI